MAMISDAIHPHIRSIVSRASHDLDNIPLVQSYYEMDAMNKKRMSEQEQKKYRSIMIAAKQMILLTIPNLGYQNYIDFMERKLNNQKLQEKINHIKNTGQMIKIPELYSVLSLGELEYLGD